jgi:uncharacterized membrane protein
MLDYLILIILSMSPFSENRGAIIYGLATGISPWIFLPIVMIANILAIYPLFWFLRRKRIMGWANKLLGKRITKLIEDNRKRLELYEEVALLFFVAIPMLGTGAWTGSLVASVLKMKPRKAMLIISIGVLIAGMVVFLSAYGIIKLLPWI